jgi:hypothetical protein
MQPPGPPGRARVHHRAQHFGAERGQRPALPLRPLHRDRRAKPRRRQLHRGWRDGRTRDNWRRRLSARRALVRQLPAGGGDRRGRGRYRFECLDHRRGRRLSNPLCRGCLRCDLHAVVQVEAEQQDPGRCRHTAGMRPLSIFPTPCHESVRPLRSSQLLTPTFRSHSLLREYCASITDRVHRSKRSDRSVFGRASPRVYVRR